ncbi:GDSL-type esterase/lipase family protein [Stella sp.]|uniref:GDSL-type esterase/lipase family protein n=1 Tax=Stella sp. TaxID=2912054 RepID=UPI0035ADDEF0
MNRPFLPLLLLAAVLATAPAAAGKFDCRAPEAALETAGELPAVAAAKRAGTPLRVTIVGSASTGGAGTSAPGKSYAAKLAAALARRLGIPVTVEAHGRRGWGSEAMVEEMPDIVAADEPQLVIWQTGTVDAVREVAPEQFGAALLKGAEALKRARVDLLLMDMQFSPIGARLIDFGPYLDYMNWVAAGTASPIFHRHAVMRAWTEEDRFGAPGRAKADQQAYADHVHACIAELLARVIDDVQAATPAR